MKESHFENCQSVRLEDIFIKFEHKSTGILQVVGIEYPMHDVICTAAARGKHRNAWATCVRRRVSE